MRRRVRAAGAAAALAAVVAIGSIAPAAARGSAAVSCSISAGGINFGIYDPLSSVGDASTGTLRLSCTGGDGPPARVSFTVSMDAGLSGRFAMRTMLSGANALDYNIYWDPQHTQIVGDGSGGSQVGTLGPVTVHRGRGASVAATLYGYAPAAQDPAAGNYGDVITVTVTY